MMNTHPQHNIFQPQTTGSAPPATSPPLASRAPPVSQDPFATAPRYSFHKDLLGDDDETHQPSVLHDKSAEIGNLQNHVNSTNKSLQNAKAEREALEATLANQAAQLSALQTQLTSAKASFETETNVLNALKERHDNQNAEIQRVREELIRSESDLSAIRVEKVEIEGSFLRDKEEVRDLHRRMTEVTAQIATTKQEMEKVKKDAKQQKGLLAIARKQLATKESEKAKVDQELEEARVDLASTIKEREEAEGEAEKASASLRPLAVPERADSLIFAAAHPLPVTPDITGGVPLSPSSSKSNNPFERLAMSSGLSTPRSQSPFKSFSTTSMPLPPGLTPLPPPDGGVTTLDDPFGISHAFDSQAQPFSEVTPDTDTGDVGASTPKVKPTLGEFAEVVSSPTDDELFSTPPNSTTPVNHGGEATPHFHSLDTAAVHFPALEDIPSRQVHGKENETDLTTDLHELDVNESDSDTDSDEEESHKGPSQDKPSHPPEVSPSKNEPVPPPAPVSFDDIFSAPSHAPEVNGPPAPDAAPHTENVSSTQNGSAAFDAFGVPLTKPAATSEDGQDSGFTFINTPADVASKGSSGISSLDEAFGKGAFTGPAQTASNFSFESTFESAFEDNFDFSVSSGATSSDAPPANGGTTTKQSAAVAANSVPDAFSLPVNGGSSATPKAAPAQAPVSFDAPFSSGPWTSPTGASQPEKTVSNQPGPAGITFEEAFGGLDSSQALKLDDSFSSQAPNPATNLASPPHHDAAKQFPTVSPPTSPRGPASPRVTSSIRSNSPQPRATSPPPRVASPKSQRPSTSSSSTKDIAHEKPPPPPRHSKLSIRLPFGRRKKQESVPPVPAPRSAPPLPRVDEPGVVTPAVEDDVDSVKQITGMGFSRHQAVAALEAHGYDVPRALNSLLGA
jgi:epidermal growth factor receptor substrate 15